MYINRELMEYIRDYVFPIYEKNDKGHDINHIIYVIRRSLDFASQINKIDNNMVYTIAAYHDIAHHIDKDNHEILSAKALFNDGYLKAFFFPDEMIIMKEAIEDHRASNKNEPRSIYGKIVSSADRNTSVDSVLERAYSYRITHNSNLNIDDIIEDSRKHIANKFGNGGYATKKMYFEDKEYEKFLKDIDILVRDEGLFRNRFIYVNNIDYETMKLVKK